MSHSQGKWSNNGSKKQIAIAFVVLFGLVSLMADMTNEGIRSVTGTYLALLGASAVAVAFVSGLSELVGYSLRIAFGVIADRTGRYWTLVFVGYGINLVVVPLLALSGDWVMAATLILIEKVGRAVRGPARDAMISHASTGVGRGWAYGVQEALSSTGGMLGPIIVMAVLIMGGSYPMGIALLTLPLMVMVVLLVIAFRMNPRPREMEGRCAVLDTRRKLPRAFWLFVLAGALIAAGYSDFPLVALHMSRYEEASESWIPLLYALAMAADALSALVFGKAYDRKGMALLVPALAVVPIFVPMIFSSDMTLIVAGMVLYGVGFGAQESTMRAIVADMAPYCRRGSAFGYYNAAFGISWFLGSLTIGLLYDVSVAAMVAFSMAMQLAAVPVLLRVKRSYSFRPRGWSPRQQGK